MSKSTAGGKGEAGRARCRPRVCPLPTTIRSGSVTRKSKSSRERISFGGRLRNRQERKASRGTLIYGFGPMPGRKA